MRRKLRNVNFCFLFVLYKQLNHFMVQREKAVSWLPLDF